MRGRGTGKSELGHGGKPRGTGKVTVFFAQSGFALAGRLCIVPGMKRRDFLVQTGLVAGAVCLARVPAWAQPRGGAIGAEPGLHRLRRNIGLYTERGGTIGWLANDTGTAVIDTQFPDTATKALALMQEGREGPFDLTINTHHHGDHTSGNPVFGPASRQLVAHANVPGLQRRAAEQRGTLDQQVYATTTFTDAWRIDLGDETIAARYFGAAHTSGDIAVLFEKANVVHVGDLCFNRLYPFIDRGAGANIGHWITVVEQLVATYPADAIFVCGHGKAAWGVTAKAADLLAFRDYLSGLLDYTQKQIAAGTSREALVKLDNLPGFPEFHDPAPNRLGANLGDAYDELTATT